MRWPPGNSFMGLRDFIGEVSVKCLYWLPTACRPDLCNLLAASHDLLEVCGLIEDDRLIMSVDGSRIQGKDADNPRVEIEILPFQGPGVSLASPVPGPPAASQRLDFRVQG
jgi:hypothetical protein